SYSQVSRSPSCISGSSSTIRTLGNEVSFAGGFLCAVCGHCMAGQQDREPAALPGSAVHQDLPVMGIHDVFHQCESQAGAAHRVHQIVADPVELLKDFLLLGSRNANAMIDHFNRDLPFAALNIDFNASGVSGILD